MATIIKFQLLLLAKISKFDKNVKTKEISIEYKYHAIKRFEIKEATHDQIAQDLGVNHSLIMRSLNKSMTIQTMTKSKNLEQTMKNQKLSHQTNFININKIL